MDSEHIEKEIYSIFVKHGVSYDKALAILSIVKNDLECDSMSNQLNQKRKSEYDYILYDCDNIRFRLWKRLTVCVFESERAIQKNGVEKVKRDIGMIITILASAISVLSLVEFHFIGFLLLISLSLSIYAYVNFNDEVEILGYTIDEMRKDLNYL
ncbi:hypothetical protein ACFQ5D_23230 [Paenibacillus farraposensis]|uniref:Uncharacterized protein n=1 Tax=Paenibacillus farraposensis TaxID=2807095 RepID=A0ABW4DML1_9BACL|nr:hypothetical protein [Paenibacillus farraposensis]MCC3381063.1 hypothetical protein [Paenibacillus farraposensis]